MAKVAAKPVIVERKRIKHHSTNQAEGKTHHIALKTTAGEVAIEQNTKR